MRQPQKIVVHFLDHTILKGHARFFFHHQRHLLMETAEGEERLIPFPEVKAIFFVRSFAGDRRRAKKNTFESGSPSFGVTVRVTFLDGETLLGRSVGYKPEEQGFYLKPADPGSNNEMVYIPQTAVREVVLGEDAAP